MEYRDAKHLLNRVYETGVPHACKFDFALSPLGWYLLVRALEAEGVPTGAARDLVRTWEENHIDIGASAGFRSVAPRTNRASDSVPPAG